MSPSSASLTLTKGRYTNEENIPISNSLSFNLYGIYENKETIKENTNEFPKISNTLEIQQLSSLDWKHKL